MSKPDTTEIGIIGPVNGLGEKSINGSYYKIIIMPAHEARREFIVTRDQVLLLKDECTLIERTSN